MAPYIPPVVYQRQAEILICKGIAPAPQPIIKKFHKSAPFVCNAKNLAKICVPISSIAIPWNWQQTEGGDWGVFKFRIDHKDDVIFEIRRLGYQTLDEFGHLLKETTEKPPHRLGLSEWSDLVNSLHLEKKPSDFAIKFARTSLWNGRTVVESEGSWMEAVPYEHEAGTTEYALNLDMYNNDGTTTEILYRAPREEFARYLPKAKQCMKSIKWTELRR